MAPIHKAHTITRSAAGTSSHQRSVLPAVSSLLRSSGGSSWTARPVLLPCNSSTPSTASPATDTSSVTDTRTATVQVDLGYAAEQAVVTLTQPNSKLVEATMAFPLGLVLEDVDGEVVVTEVTEGSAAAEAECRVGDVVRATTAFTMQMTYPTMQLMFGGGGTPKLMKILIPANKLPAAKVLDAVRSNTRGQGGDGKVTLVLERVGVDADADNTGGSNGSSGRSEEASSDAAGQGLRVVPGAGDDSRPGAVFDPRIFNSTFE